MKPAPAIPKTLEAKVARVARRLRKAPRLVLGEAIDEYVARHDPEAVT
jgi:predicted transcriptional regulator